ncbi:hypothetical protein SAMN05216276_1010106 [Streptosporangium subroseum]|uniref:Uncharacterized protein n=1 Tax=Streptosporangium subroseum TaxID=106412 RepID=A0A239EZ31_9ACTN|nr:hypothetical protein SAMN05216276_1010106 [Streptosporangium subroseum]
MIDLAFGRPDETDAGGHTPALAALTNTMVKPANGTARRLPAALTVRAGSIRFLAFVRRGRNRTPE